MAKHKNHPICPGSQGYIAKCSCQNATCGGSVCERGSALQALKERAAAVVASLSSSEAAAQPLREANAVPPLIALLEIGVL